MARQRRGSQDITLTVTLDEPQAWLYAQFLKRVTFDDYRARAIDSEEAYIMVAAGERIREALRAKGFAPR